MAVTMWQSIMNIFTDSTFQAALWTVVTFLATGVLYVKLRERLIASDIDSEHARTNRRLLKICLAFVLLIVVVTIWAAVLRKDIPGAGGDAASLLNKLLWTCGIALVIYVIVSGLQKTLSKDITAIEVRHKVRLATNWAGIGIFVVATAMIWAAGIRDFGIFLGIVGAGLALSLQETLVCIAGWLLFVVRRPYDIGDRIEIDNKIGDVIGVSVFQTTMLEVGNWIKAEQSSGRMLIIPNSMLIRHAIYNYGKGFPFVWDEISVIVTFESDWEEAEKLMLEKAEVEADKIAPQVETQIRKMQDRYAIRYEHLTPTIYVRIVDNGVELTLRYLCPVRERRAVTHRLSRNILGVFMNHPKIDFAYPTTRIFRNNEEGKPATGGPNAPG